MVYLIQGDEFEIEHEMFERLAAVIAESEDLTLVDARYRLRTGHGILRFEDRAEAERVAGRFTEMGFANFLLDELLEVPRVRLVGPQAGQVGEPVRLVVLARLATETKRQVREIRISRARIGLGGIPAPGGTVDEHAITERKTRYCLDLFTKEKHWRMRAGTLGPLVDVFAELDVSEAHLNEGMRSLTRSDRQVRTFRDESDYEKYLTWLFQLGFA